MASAQDFEARAVQRLETYLSANLPTELRSVETDESLTANSLTDPVDYVRSFVPNEHRTPLCAIWAEGSTPVDHRNSIAFVDCVVAFGYFGDAGAAGMEAADLVGWRYLQATRRLLDTDPKCGATDIIQAYWTASERDSDLRGDAMVYHARGLAVSVEVHAP